MSNENTNYQIVFLINSRQLTNDVKYKNNVVACVLKLLTFYSSKVKAEISEKLQWDFAFFDKSSCSHQLPSYRFRNWNRTTFENFEQELNRYTDQRQSETERESPTKSSVEKLKLAFAEVLSSFPWDRPLITSPVKRVGSRTVTCKGTNGKSSTQGQFDDEDIVQLKTNVLFILSHCPHSQEDVINYVKMNRMPNSSSLTAHLMPRQIVRAISDKKISVFWIDTYFEKSPTDLSGFQLIANILQKVGGMLTVTALLGGQINRQPILPAATPQNISYVDTMTRLVPDSTVIGYYLDDQHWCYDNQPGDTVDVLSSGKRELFSGKLQASIVSNTKDSQPRTSSICLSALVLRRIMIVGTMPLSQVPLSHLEIHPMYVLTKSSADIGNTWSQLLIQLAASDLVVLVECCTAMSALPTLGILQAVTSLSGSLTLLKTSGSLLLRKQLAFGVHSSSKSSDITRKILQADQLHTSDEKNGWTAAMVLSPPQSQYPAAPMTDRFDGSLLESWLIPGAVPSCLANNCKHIYQNEEDSNLLSRLQMAYIRHKTRRLNNMGSVSNSSAPSMMLLSPRRSHRSPQKGGSNPTRRSPRKKAEAHGSASRRMSPRKAVKQKSLVRSLRTKTSTAPSRVDFIMAKSKEYRHTSKDDQDKKLGRKSSEMQEDLMPSTSTLNAPDVQTEDDLFQRAQEIYDVMLESTLTPRVAASRILMLAASFSQNNEQVTMGAILSKCAWRTAAEISKKYLQGSQHLKVLEYECQIWLWMDAINRSWIKDNEQKEKATQQIIIMLRSLSFLQDHAALSLHLSELMLRYVETLPEVLHEIYEELGQPLPPQLQAVVSPSDVNAAPPSQPPSSALSGLNLERDLKIGVLSNKEKVLKKMHRHSSFHAVTKRQIQMNTKNKGTKDLARRSARIASASKTKQKKNETLDEDTKFVRRNLFCEGAAVKLERRQSVAVMETSKHRPGNKSRIGHHGTSRAHKAGHKRRDSHVFETPAHKQVSNQLWAKQEKKRQRADPVDKDVSVIQESPDKKSQQLHAKQALQEIHGVAVPKLYKRTSFYSGDPDRMSRNVNKYEKLEARLINRNLLSPCTKAAVRNSLTSPRRRVHITTLFSRLMDPSPQKVSRGCGKSTTPLKGLKLTFDEHTPKKSEPSREDPVTAAFSSPSKNTRAQMRLFQSPSPESEPAPSKCGALTFKHMSRAVCLKEHSISPQSFCMPGNSMSPSKSTRSATRLLLSPPLTLPEPPHSLSNTSKTPVKHEQLTSSSDLFSPSKYMRQAQHQSKTHTVSTRTPQKLQHLTPVKSHKTPQKLQHLTPVKSHMTLAFTSPSSNTRSHTKIFQPPEIEFTKSSHPKQDPWNSRQVPIALMAKAESFVAPDVSLHSTAVLSTPTKNPVQMCSPSTLIVNTPSKNTRLQTRLFHSPPDKQGCLQNVKGDSKPTGEYVLNSQQISQKADDKPFETNTSPKKVLRSDFLNEWPRKKPHVSPVLKLNKSSTSPVMHKRGKLCKLIRSVEDSSDKIQQENIGISCLRSPLTSKGKRKLSACTSPVNDGTPSKRLRSSNAGSPVGSKLSKTSMDYFENDYGPRKGSQTSVRVGSSITDLKHLSTGSTSVQSPIFPGIGSIGLSEDDINNSAPSSPIFDTVFGNTEDSPFRSPRKDAKTYNKSLGLTHFSPQLSKFSITQLVKSPLLSSAGQKKNQGRECPGRVSPPKKESCGNGNHERVPKARKSLIRMPTKQAL